MRPYTASPVLALALVLAAGCAEKNPGTTPPLNAFHYPVAVAIAEPATPLDPSVKENQGKVNGFLYVVSSNFDLKYNRGVVHALDLFNLPALPGENPTPHKPLSLLGTGIVGDPNATGARTDYAFIASFAGTPAMTAAGADPLVRTLFIPTRENAEVYGLTTNGAALSCRSGGQDCVQGGTGVGGSQGVQLVVPKGQPFADETAQDPFAAAILGENVFVTHLRNATRPGGVGTSDAFLVRLPIDLKSPPTFTSLGGVPAAGIAATAGVPPNANWLFLTGRATTLPLRWAGSDPQTSGVRDAGLNGLAAVLETRGVAFSSDGNRLFVTTRGTRNSSVQPASGPDGMVVLDVSPNAAGEPTNTFIRFVPLPAGASDMVVIPRPNGGPRTDLVAVSCTESNVVAIYDETRPLTPVALVNYIVEPFGLAVGRGAAGEDTDTHPHRRIYVASFSAQMVAIVDVDLTQPWDANIRGYIGEEQ